jgi:hypothetical protein
MWATVRAFVDLDRPFDDVEGEPPRAFMVNTLHGLVPEIDDAFLQGLLGKDEAGINAAFLAINLSLDPDSVAAIARSELYVHNVDVTAFHSNDAPIGANGVEPPFGWEVGRYGVRGIDNHAIGKPSTGVHLSIEAQTLNGLDAFAPGDEWVSGAQAFALGDLNPGATATFDVLFSLNTAQSVTEKPTIVSPQAGFVGPVPPPAGKMKMWRGDGAARRPSKVRSAGL